MRDYTQYITTTIGFAAKIDNDLARVADLSQDVLVLMVRGLFLKLDHIYARFAHGNSSADLIFGPIWEATLRLERLGF